MRTILIVLIGLAMWVISLIVQEYTVGVAITLTLAIINSLLIAQTFYKRGITNIPSLFVAGTYWFGMALISILHPCWQTQLVVMGGLLSLLILTNIDYQQEATEEVFLASLICCFALPTRIIIIIGLLVLWIYLIVKRHMTWRVWAASLIALALRILLMVVVHHFGWIERYWSENIPNLPWQDWAIFGGLFFATILAILLPIRKPSVGSGIFYIIYSIMLLTIGGVMVWQTII